VEQVDLIAKCHYVEKEEKFDLIEIKRSYREQVDLTEK